MRVFVDLDVLLDALQKREPHFNSSFEALEFLTQTHNDLFVSLHSIATLYYFLNKHAGREQAQCGVRWVLTHFQIARCKKEQVWNSIEKDYRDFEDGIVAEEADLESCDWILTRNVKDFQRSSVPPINPNLLLERVKRP